MIRRLNIMNGKNYIFALFVFILAFSGCKSKEIHKAEIFADLNGKVGAGIIFYNDFMIAAKDGELLKITPDKKISVFCGLKDLPEGRNYYYDSPLVWDMKLDKDNNIIAAAQDRILRISSKGEITTLIRKDFEGFLGATGVEVDKEGNIYVTCGAKILKYDAHLRETVFFDFSSVGNSYNSLFSLKFSADYEFLYLTNFDLKFNSSALFKIPIEAGGKAGSPEILFDTNTKCFLNGKPVICKGNPLNIIFGNKDSIITSIDITRLLLKIDKSGKKEFIDMGNIRNHCIAFGGKGFDENSLYITTQDGKVYKYEFDENAEK
jgi:hypothetical protein